MRKAILASLLIVACQKKDPPNESSRPVLNDSSIQTPSKAASESNTPFKKPDEQSFFPLVEGSYWVYEAFQDNEKQEGFREEDSVESLTLTDTGYVARMVIKDAKGRVSHPLYWVDKEGLVWTNRWSEPSFKKYTSLIPKLGGKIDSLTYFPCSTAQPADEKCKLLQPYEGDKEGLTEEQSTGWNGRFYEKGIGLESRAGSEISRNLVEYRIGLNGKVLHPSRMNEN